jgi:hypothetical protein
MDAAQAGPQHLEPLAQLDTVPATLHAGGKTSSIRFLADRGANITAIQLSDLGLLGMSLASLPKVNPLPADPQLADRSCDSMSLVGTLRASIMVGSMAVTTDIYIAHHLAQPILSRKASIALGIYQAGPNSVMTA